MLNLPAFLFRTVYCTFGTRHTGWSRKRSVRRDTFYSALRYMFSRFLHENRSAFIAFIWDEEPDG